MKNNRQLFFEYLAQTTTNPLAVEIVDAKGIYLYAADGKKYVDLVSGVSVSNVGHCHPKVVDAIKTQVDKYMHLMVYGEMVQAPQSKYAELLVKQLPSHLTNVYLVNSGSEAVDGALKLAKRATRKHKIIACKNAYHGGTHGALSILGNETLKQPFRPLLPGVSHIRFNCIDDLKTIDEDTACVVIEPIQAEAGIIPAEQHYMEALRKRCDEVGALLIFDEIQTGFGRTGKLFAFQHYGIEPDIITLAKGMGGGMPIGAFVASKELMALFTHDPALGHITTFGGHPVSCASAKATLEVIIDDDLAGQAAEKGNYIRSKLTHPCIKTIRGEGLFLAVELKDVFIPDFMNYAAENGIIFDPFLFNSAAFRIAPPLIITYEEIDFVIQKLIQLIDEFTQNK